jgi:hypothetical protein
MEVNVKYKDGKQPKSIPLAWRAVVTRHEEVIDRPYPEKGYDQQGKPWVDAKTWAVARVLDDHMDAKGVCWPSYATIAAEARISRTAAMNGIDRLVGAGLLEKKQRRLGPKASDANLYRALVPGRDQGSPGADERQSRAGTQSPHEVHSASPNGSAHICAKCGGRGAGSNEVELCKKCWPAEWGAWV